MIEPLPWLHGIERNRPAARFSARVRLSEAIEEARSSLEQFSGISTPSQVQRRTRQVGLFLVQCYQSWKGAWRRRSSKRAVSATASVRPLPPSHPKVSWHRLPAHLAILFLLGILMFAGGFRGVLAQPIRTNQAGGGYTWQRVRLPDESLGILGDYDSIPPVPVVLYQPRPVIAAPAPIVDDDVSNTPMSGEVVDYTVQDGDTLGAIAARFNLSIETLYWFNGLKSADSLSIGLDLQVPPVDGLPHEVEDGDTLDSIAEEYGVLKGDMIAYAPNELREPYTLEVEEEIFVPGASKPIPRPAVTRGWKPTSGRLTAPTYNALPGGEHFSWPAVGRITDRFGWTGTRWHIGLDIAASWGTPIYAAASGTVTYAGWRGNYGYLVEMDHGEGWVTRYGHMAQVPDVSVGQWVERGQLIGFIGCTGYCTGPHVHFEIRYGGEYTDPLDYLQ